jgi:hypothetical protein
MDNPENFQAVASLLVDSMELMLRNGVSDLIHEEVVNPPAKKLKIEGI